MNTKFKGLIKKIYLDGVKNHKLSPDLQEKEIKKLKLDMKKEKSI